MKEQRLARWALVAGVLSVSISAILIRWAEAPPLATGAWRKLLAAALLIPVALWRSPPRPGPGAGGPRDSWIIPALGAGLLLGLHFGTWITSVYWTDIASSMVLVAVQPVFAALFGSLFLGDAFTKRDGVALGLAVAGFVLVGWPAEAGAVAGLHPFWGNVLAFLGGIFAAAYLVVGRSVRNRAPMLPYLCVVYGVAGVLLGIAAWFAGDSMNPADYTAHQWLLFLLMALFPTFLGHNLFNYAVRHMDAFRVNVAILLEPVLAGIYAWFLWREAPSGMRVWIGAACIFAGACAAFLPSPHPSATPPPGAD